jgi:ribosome-associated protein
LRSKAIVRPPTRKEAPRKRAVKPPAESLPAPPGTPRKKASIAGPGRKKADRQVALPELDRMQSVICASLEDDKAEEIVAIDLAGRASFADRMVVATGLADRQISAMATHLNEKLVEAGFRKVRMEGASGTDWVLIDAGDIIVHLFKPEARSLYALEKMWGPELDEAAAVEE